MQPDREAQPFLPIGRMNHPAMVFDDPFRNGEPQSRSACGLMFRTEKRFEQVFQVLFRKGCAGVFQRDGQVFSRGCDFYDQITLFGRIFGGIVQKIGKGRAKGLPVGDQVDRGGIFGQDPDAFPFKGRPESFEEFVQEDGEIQRFKPEG